MSSRHVAALVVCTLVWGGPVGCGGESPVPGSETERAPVSAESGNGPAGSNADPFADDPIPPLTDPLFRRVDREARRRADASYAESDDALPPPLRDIGYDEYRSIRFRPEEAVWRGDVPFEIQLFHPGYRYSRPVAIHLVEGGETRTLAFDPERFRYEGEAETLAEIDAPDAGYAGFRVHYPMNDGPSKDEVVAFLGASYFRLLGPGQVYGLSSRGLAVDAGLPTGEEFPDFREFWLVRPEPDTGTLTFYALLDGPSVTGAYRFELDPGDRSEGEATVLTVEARLNARDDVGKLGVAPLSSMFLFDANNASDFDDYRPRVHDSHGLLALTGRGEWIWRPLHNGPGLRVTQLRDDDPRGFGLVQRERSFESYLDLEARYDRRPSEWVEIGDGHWGTGGVELMEIPTESEFNDNIVASWVPDVPFSAGDHRYYRYRLVTFDDRVPAQGVARVERTRIGWDALPGQTDPPPRSHRRFVVDFGGGDPEVLPSDSTTVVLTTSAGTLGESRVESLPSAGSWRVTFDLEPEGDRPSDMRLYLKSGDRPLTETWSYVWYPESVE